MNNLPYSQEIGVSSTEASPLSLDKIHCLKLCESSCSISSYSHEYRIAVGRKQNTWWEGISLPIWKTWWNTVNARGWRILVVTAKSQFSQGHLFEETSDGSSKVSASPERQPVPSSCTSPLQVWALGCSQASLMLVYILHFLQASIAALPSL